MKIIHAADIHLGAKPDKQCSFCGVREKEIWTTLERLVETVRKEKPELFIIAGDLFHRPPLTRELREVDALFSQLTDTIVVLIAGNHDYIREQSAYEHYQFGSNVIFLKNRDCEHVSIPELGVDLYGLSYYRQEIAEPLYDSILPVNPEALNILVGHGGDEKHIPFHPSVIAGHGFHYLAFGHMHKPDWSERDRFANPGSLVPLDVTETGKHGYIRAEITRERASLVFVPFAEREYRTLNIKMDADMTRVQLHREITRRMEEGGPEHMYSVYLEGSKSMFTDIDPQEISMLGNIVKVVDETVPEYDYQKLQMENEENMLGIYISLFGEPGKNSVEEKALRYGVQALLEEINR